jgi:hypothetical protein
MKNRMEDYEGRIGWKEDDEERQLVREGWWCGEEDCIVTETIL